MASLSSIHLGRNGPIDFIDLTADSEKSDIDGNVPIQTNIEQPASPNNLKLGAQGDMSFIATVAHRSPRPPRSIGPIIPAKRKVSPERSHPSPRPVLNSSDLKRTVAGSSTAPSPGIGSPVAGLSTAGPSADGPSSPRGGAQLTFSMSRQSPSTPPPRREALPGVEVVIPSPLSRQSKPKAESDEYRPDADKPPYGIREEFYDTKTARAKKAAKRAYPTRVKDVVSRSDVQIFSTGFLSPDLRNVPPNMSRKNPTDLLRASLNRRLQSISGPATTFNISDKKLAQLSSSFGFVNEYVLLDGVERVDEGFNSGCNCFGPCDPTGCDCLFEEEDTDEKILTYHEVDGRFLLRPIFLNRRSKIVECCALCSCKGNCWNTVVQQGRQVRFEIFDTGNRGLGLRSLDPIVAGQYIDRYLGEVLTQEEADAREMSKDTGSSGQSYLFILDWQTDSDQNEADEEDPEEKEYYVVDGQKFGSATRFINHSCDPNCKIIPVSTTEHGDDKIYYLAFFALRDIPAGTELTFDYNPSSEKLEKGQKIDPDAVKCLCQAANCRGQLWRDARKKGYGSTATPRTKATPATRVSPTPTSNPAPEKRGPGRPRVSGVGGPVRTPGRPGRPGRPPGRTPGRPGRPPGRPATLPTWSRGIGSYA